jgi:hypothetical protein
MPIGSDLSDNMQLRPEQFVLRSGLRLPRWIHWISQLRGRWMHNDRPMRFVLMRERHVQWRYLHLQLRLPEPWGMRVQLLGHRRVLRGNARLPDEQRIRVHQHGGWFLVWPDLFSITIERSLDKWS